jgi:hypothetical protein
MRCVGARRCARPKNASAPRPSSAGALHERSRSSRLWLSRSGAKLHFRRVIAARSRDRPSSPALPREGDSGRGGTISRSSCASASRSAVPDCLFAEPSLRANLGRVARGCQALPPCSGGPRVPDRAAFRAAPTASSKRANPHRGPSFGSSEPESGIALVNGAYYGDDSENEGRRGCHVGPAVAGSETVTARLAGALRHRGARPRPSLPHTPARQPARRRRQARRDPKPPAAVDPKVSNLRQTALDRGRHRVRVDQDVPSTLLSAGFPVTSGKDDSSAVEMPRQLGGFVARPTRSWPTASAMAQPGRVGAPALPPPTTQQQSVEGAAPPQQKRAQSNALSKFFRS